ncbi:hypothetical protein MOPEL_003_00600 [Mobilicoccus pelagius NBRC 104925]|uniref:Uncharacterized protein n=2 Tax=Mobilicoccus TaxID=984996 RepID=H5UMS8_9MICO|nr:hypothetical protein MOPEL_003_00600 [Mobilicoccus pelagius NBRC 104925]
MLGLAPLAYGVGLLAGGPAIATSALAGVGLTALFLCAGLLGLRLVLEAHEALVLPGVLSVLGFQVLALLALWTQSQKAPSSLPALDAVAFGYGALAAALLWQASLVGVLMHTRQLLYPTVAIPTDEEVVR